MAWLGWGVLLASVLGGCGRPPTPPGGSLRFTDIRCLPDVSIGQSLIVGHLLSCTFRVLGSGESTATLGCEDEAGRALDCGPSSRTQLQPFGPRPLPIEDGSFTMPTEGLSQGRTVVTWRVDDEKDQARHRLEAQIVPDDGVNQPPSILFDCDGDTDGAVKVAAGSPLTCRLMLMDPDPDTVSWSYAVASTTAPKNEPTPFGGAGVAPFELTWRWSTDASEAGTRWTYTFSASDGAAPAVTRNLDVSVE